MVPWHLWKPEMLDWGPPKGPFLTRDAAKYPGPMNRGLAETLVRSAAVVRLAQGQSTSMIITGR